MIKFQNTYTPYPKWYHDLIFHERESICSILTKHIVVNYQQFHFEIEDNIVKKELLGLDIENLLIENLCLL